MRTRFGTIHVSFIDPDHSIRIGNVRVVKLKRFRIESFRWAEEKKRVMVEGFADLTHALPAWTLGSARKGRNQSDANVQRCSPTVWSSPLSVVGAMVLGLKFFLWTNHYQCLGAPSVQRCFCRVFYAVIPESSVPPTLITPPDTLHNESGAE